MPKFETVVRQSEGFDATGIEVPGEIVESLGQGKRPKVTVTINGHSYRSTVAVYGGSYALPLAKQHREAAGVKANDKIVVQLEPDMLPREVNVPYDLLEALGTAGVTEALNSLSFTHRKEQVRAIEEAKALETRAGRIEKTVALARSKMNT